MVIPLSVTIIAKDEADRIGRPIASVKDWVDEVIVVDSGSADATMKVAEELGAKVFFHTWNGYGQQKIFAERQCRNKWILNLDADEEVTPELAVNIQKLFQDCHPERSEGSQVRAGDPSASPQDDIAAYKLFWRMVMPGEVMPPRFAPKYGFIRLYNKEKAGFRDSTVHDSVVVREGDVGKVGGIVLHRCFRGLEHWTHKINYYSTMQAEDFVQKGRKPNALRIILEPFVSFLKSYIIRRYCLYGLDGFVASVQYGYARMLRLAKARELLRHRGDGR